MEQIPITLHILKNSLELLGKPGPITTVRTLPDGLRRAMSEVPAEINFS
jgi:hypothetical protein